MGIRSPPLTQAEVIARQNRSWTCRIAGGCVGSPGRVALYRVQPAHQVSHRAPDRVGTTHRIQWSQMQMPDAGFSGRGLGLNLDQPVVSGQRTGPN